MDLLICIAITVSTYAAGVRKSGLVYCGDVVLLYQKRKIEKPLYFYLSVVALPVF